MTFADTEGSSPEEQEALTAAPKQELSAPKQASGPVSGLDGDFTSRDIKLPRLNLVQKMSAAVDEGFRPGDILFRNGDVTIPLELPGEVTIVNLRKQYQEKLPYGTTEMPRTFDSAADVRAAGLTTNYGEEGYCQEIAHIQVLFSAPADTPEDLLDLFPYSYDGKDYAIALMTLSASSYTAAAKPIITAFMSHLRGKHWTGKWILGSDKKSGGGNTWYVPTVKMNGKHTPEFAEFVEGLISGE